jgi:UDP-N-acetylglucosamine 2-epimerase (non-hydrolysing)
MKFLVVVGARPNFMKAAPVIRDLDRVGAGYVLVHTGQHYDTDMSGVFFEELGIPEPEINLGAGSDTHAAQTAYIMESFDNVCEVENPDNVLVFGDVNSTMACAIAVAKRHGIRLSHIEAGERSFDRRMPEEINRVVTDVLSDYLFCATYKAKENLMAEGIDSRKIYVVGNVSIDNLLYCRSEIEPRRVISDYILATIHRASNTNNVYSLGTILDALNEISQEVPIVFPMHPRTRRTIKKFGLEDKLGSIGVTEPLSYFDFVKRMMESAMVITDSGGIQVETTVLNKPCLTIRENTEWEFTLNEGTNTLLGCLTKDDMVQTALRIMEGEHKQKNLSVENAQLLDGGASRRIVGILTNHEKREGLIWD